MTTTTEMIKAEPVEKKSVGRPKQVMRILDKRDKPNMDVYLVETPPQPVAASIIRKEYILEMPWLYYVACIYKTKSTNSRWYPETAGKFMSRIATVYCRSSKATKDDSPLYYIPLPNLYPGTRTFCHNTGVIDADITEEQKINQAIGNFWGANFSYICAGTEPGVWKAIAEKAKSGTLTTTSHYSTSDSIGKAYAWWETLSAEEVLTLPWGKIKWSSLDTVTKGQYYGYESFG